MDTLRVVGEIQSFEQASKSELSFSWNHKVPSEDDCWESPSIRLIDGFGFDHKWKLQVEKVFVESNSQPGPTAYRLSIEYLGKLRIQNTDFTIRCQVFGKEGRRTTEKVLYDDSTVEKNGKIGSQNFSERKSYKITSLPSSMYSFKIFCKITTTMTIFDMKSSIPWPNQHDIWLKDEYEQLFASGKFSDVTFIINDKKLHLHKSILSNRSVVFAAMFNHNIEENNSNEVAIDDQSYEVMTEFFRYLYAAKVNKLEDHVISLLMTANKYEVEGLKFLCEHYLIETLKNENVLDYLNIANCYNARKLEAECMKFLLSNAKEIVELPTFDLSSLPDELKNDLFRGIARKL
ncbi:hypothetical protein QAD02_004907 [Eretmocerus hayati]|uniref:Uncharacterized protein n=1 Tax=Eretmocerus hayati TaxID=131215 RepID=A0ACC2NQV2_9HYME|nr:hypothetical protein QAD02_004907 [Eretmocerus hayati]